MGYTIMPEFKGRDGTIVKERYEVSFLGIENLQYLSFNVQQLPEELKGLEPEGFNKIWQGTLEHTLRKQYGTSLYKPVYASFKGTKLSHLASTQ